MKKIIIASLVTVAAVVANGELVGYWNFDNDDLAETSGYTAAGTHDGVATVDGGTPSFIDGHSGGGADYGRALDIAAGGSVKVLNSNAMIGGSGGTEANPTYMSTFDDFANEMSISMWIQGLPSTWGSYASKEGEAAGYQLRKRRTGPNLCLTLRSDGGEPDPNGGSTTWNEDGGWHHVAGVWNKASGTRLLYIDGVLDGSSITDGSDTNSIISGANSFLMFGDRDNGGAINGAQNVQVDEIRIYNNALTESEVQTLAIPEPGTLGLIAVFGGGMLFARRRFKR